MSFQPPRLNTFIRVPPIVNRVRFSPARQLAPAGTLALVAAGCGAVAYFQDTSTYATSGKIAIIGAIVAAVVGGALALIKQEVGAPIAAGGCAIFIPFAATYLGTFIDFHSVFDELRPKLLLAAGILGLLTAIVALVGLGGRGNPGLGTVIALLALAQPICFGVIQHIDDAHPASLVGGLIGYVVVAAIIAVGGLRGRFGAITSLVAAALLVPAWVDQIRNSDDRKAASVAALISLIVIVIVAIVILATAKRVVVAVDDDPTMITDNWQRAAGTEAPVPQMAAAPVYVAPPAIAQPRIGAVVPAVSAPTMPTSNASNGQWATDPYGRYQVRYWNGTKWTDHVASNGVTGLDPIA